MNILAKFGITKDKTSKSKILTICPECRKPLTKQDLTFNGDYVVCNKCAKK
jgi:ssDNA-binding Zn-finger/Zn-ribbon topoisomerase 1